MKVQSNNSKWARTSKIAAAFALVISGLATMDFVAPKKEYALASIPLSQFAERCRLSGSPNGVICVNYNYFKIYHSCKAELYPNGLGALTQSQQAQTQQIIANSSCVQTQFKAYLKSIGLSSFPSLGYR